MSRPKVPASLRERIAEQAGHRCGYCRSAEVITGSRLTIDHIMPVARGGPTEEWNLWLACSDCNETKRDLTDAIDPETGILAPLFNPRLQIWRAHFVWSEDGTQVMGLTPTGRATVASLNLNRPLVVAARHAWVSVGWHPPVD